MPIGTKHGNAKTIPVCSCLIESYRAANINDITIIIREGKEDIPKKLESGEKYGVDIEYLYTQNPYGPPYTLDEAYSKSKNKFVAIGFPDILFTPSTAFEALIEKQQNTNADVVLGLFRAPHPEKMDMVAFDQSGAIESIQIKPQQTSLVWTWILAVWSPVFSKFMHQNLQDMLKEFESKKRTECHVGTFFQIALSEGISFEYEYFDQGKLIDIGTPDELQQIEQACPSWLR